MSKLDKEQQLDLFWKKINVFYSFFKEENPNSVGLEAFKSIAFNAFNKKRLGELKKVTAELYGFCRELPKEDKAILKQKVKDELGIDLDEEKRLAKIERILKKELLIAIRNMNYCYSVWRKYMMMKVKILRLIN